MLIPEAELWVFDISQVGVDLAKLYVTNSDSLISKLRIRADKHIYQFIIYFKYQLMVSAIEKGSLRPPHTVSEVPSGDSVQMA